jgi:D-amino-acid oxidase
MERAAVDVVVVGAGVSGLTCAVCLAEAGLRVAVRAAATDDGTTSYAAGATWSPYLVESSARVQRWAAGSLAELRGLAAVPGTGVALVAGVEAARTPTGPPPWREQLDGFRPCRPGELPEGFVSGWRWVAPVLDMPAYLRHLRGRAAAAGAAVEVRPVASLAEALRAAPVVVNCAGVGARRLVPDPAVEPVRGQVVVVENPGLGEFFVEEADPPLYFFPHGRTALLGGTAERGDWNTAPDPATAAAILQRCAAVEPRLRGVRVVGHRVGLRPRRPTVRLEPERVGDGLVVHDYGHGGAGVTLSWGCAREVAAIVAAG